MTIVTATGEKMVGAPFCAVIAAKAAQNDIVTLFDNPGVIPREVMTFANAASLSAGTPEWWEYTVIQNNGGDTSTDTSIAYKTAVAGERHSGGYYVLAPASGEILYVISDSGYDSTTGTLTCIRGCLGTTAADIAADDYMVVMNAIKLKGSFAGHTMMMYDELPYDPKAEVF
jgi:hypothetical protein